MAVAKSAPQKRGKSGSVLSFPRDKQVESRALAKGLQLLEELCETMVDGSLCALGGLTPFPVQSAMKHFPEDFSRAPRKTARAAE